VAYKSEMLSKRIQLNKHIETLLQQQRGKSKRAAFEASPFSCPKDEPALFCKDSVRVEPYEDLNLEKKLRNILESGELMFEESEVLHAQAKAVADYLERGEVLELRVEKGRTMSDVAIQIARAYHHLKPR
jgi:hypothetical protein